MDSWNSNYCSLPLLDMAVVGEDPAIFTTDALPSDAILLPTLTNAYLGTRVYRDTLHVNGVYNGAVGQTHRADLPSPLNVKMHVGGADHLRENFSLDTRTGIILRLRGSNTSSSESNEDNGDWLPGLCAKPPSSKSPPPSSSKETALPDSVENKTGL
ncbi:protein-glucosylgalactosylhydroxylysine glucosidase-like [Erythrolamprus reginae]|uniref:protein-glucosylgalactosylhydroxylysine glucosidase-like n=1 Tax=Erythrolamprus reginae TaxID=121349 RepID=UPI00396CEC23